MGLNYFATFLILYKRRFIRRAPWVLLIKILRLEQLSGSVFLRRGTHSFPGVLCRRGVAMVDRMDFKVNGPRWVKSGVKGIVSVNCGDLRVGITTLRNRVRCEIYERGHVRVIRRPVFTKASGLSSGRITADV
ncbi:hypothetical protein CEXT_481901 [Caerostris extrusa]|uniref:Uncharacterized protein n=1 Tax=Caerostris extrusa TaxID=172846 RepID=A0AAV4UEX1_CAEEX|nr:hypothetical protein CEXT_481901 [Caerostris extrusa]